MIGDGVRDDDIDIDIHRDIDIEMDKQTYTQSLLPFLNIFVYFD